MSFVAGPSTAFLTDQYELTMVRAALQSGTAFRRSVFELFGRRLPTGRRYGVVAGVGRALDAIESFRFGDEELAFLAEHGVVDDDTAHWLSSYRFTGSIWGYPEGEIYFPGSPLLIVEGSFAEAVVLETVLLSIYNYDSAVASAASRMTLMAGERPCIEMGSRRINEHAAVASARAAYVAGFTSTSNLEAGRTYGIPTTGTAAHAFTLLHDSERDAFRAQLAALGEDTILLVDTFDVEEAVRIGVELTNGRLGAIRIDSGDLAEAARDVRRLLDSLGATSTRIIVTSDLDEWQIAALRGAPVDGFGVGTSLVTGSGAPTCALVYKLVARALSDEPDAELQPVAKKSASKASIGGRKFAVRRLDDRGRAEAEVIGIGTLKSPQSGEPANSLARPSRSSAVDEHRDERRDEQSEDRLRSERANSLVRPSQVSGVDERRDEHGADRLLLVPLITDGVVVGREPLSQARARHLRTRAELPVSAGKMSRGEPAIPTILLDEQGNPTFNPYAVSES